MSVYAGAILAILILMHVTFLIALRLRRNDLADVIWGPGFLVAALGAFIGKIFAEGSIALSWQTLLALVCVAFWAFRLFYHIGLRTLKKTEEDIRYRKMRQDWGASWKLRSYFIVFLLQGFFMFVIALPLIHAIYMNNQTFDPLILIGLFIWIGGFLIEAISDAQLSKFRIDPTHKGQLMDQGLWSWSRHPNYFGEVVMWWGIFIMTLNNPYGWLMIISPLTITFLILKVSGVPMMEDLIKSKPGFAEYQRKTSVFVPLPPRK